MSYKSVNCFVLGPYPTVLLCSGLILGSQFNSSKAKKALGGAKDQPGLVPCIQQVPYLLTTSLAPILDLCLFLGQSVK